MIVDKSGLEEKRSPLVLRFLAINNERRFSEETSNDAENIWLMTSASIGEERRQVSFGADWSLVHYSLYC